MAMGIGAWRRQVHFGAAPSWKTCSGHVAVVLVAACTAIASWAAVPTAKEKAVAAMNAAAKAALDQGQFDRAAELYLQIWRQDPTQPAALLNAGRSSQLAGQVERAEELYREFLALPNPDPARNEKVRGFQLELQRTKADHKAEEAARAEREGRYDVAAALWSDACDLNRTRLGWIVRQGRAQQLAGKPDAAKATYKRWLDTAPADAPERQDVQRWLGELPPDAQGSWTPVAALPTAEAPPPVAVKQAPKVETRWGAVAVTSVGGAALAGGGVLLWLGAGKKADYDAAVAKTDSKGNIRDIAHENATEMARSAEVFVNAGIGAAALGAVGTGVGVWLWLREPAKSAGVIVVPGPNGLVLAGRF